MQFIRFVVALSTWAAATSIQAQAPVSNGTALRKAPAQSSVAPQATPILGATRAGDRLVAVGARGMVLLSDDDGRAWRQAQEVPVRSGLNAVVFADAKSGWAVGHNGTILSTVDGGEHWTLQRFDDAADQPLFSVYFSDAKHGIAVGLWSLVLATSDGGSTWNLVKLPPPPGGGKTDRNLLSVFGGPDGAIYVAAERGTVLVSKDAGATWTYHDTGYKGSFWTGVMAPDGDVYVGGLRGSLYRSKDQGKTWQAVTSGTKSSLTDIAVSGDEVVAVGLDGAVSRSADRGATFKASQREDRLALTALVRTKANTWQTFSKQGVVKP